MFSQPAARALLPGLVGAGPELAGANSLLTASSGVLNLVAPPLGALLLVWLGLPALVLIDMASYVVSAAAIAVMRRRTPSAARAARRLSSVPAELRAGLRCTIGSRTLRWLLPITFTFFAANAVFTALLVPFLSIRFGGQPGALGSVLSALGAGFLVGGPLAGWLVRGRPPRLPLTIGLAGVGACFAVLANAPTLLVAIVAVGIAGLPGALLLVTVSTTIQRITPAALLGRVGATFYASDAAAAVVGAPAGAALGRPTALPAVLTGSACVILLCAVAAPLLVRERARRDRRWSVRGIFGSNIEAISAGQQPAPKAAEKSRRSPGI